MVAITIKQEVELIFNQVVTGNWLISNEVGKLNLLVSIHNEWSLILSFARGFLKKA